MPIVTLPTNKGQYANADAWISGQPESITNLLLDEAGTLTSRPGLSAWVTISAGTGAGGSTDARILGMYPYQNDMIVVLGNRKVFRVDEDGNDTDITTDHLGGWEPPTFLEDTDGALLIFGGGRPLRVQGRSTAKYFATGLGGSPTYGAIIDRVLVVNDLGSDWYYFTDVAKSHTDFTPNLTGEGNKPGIEQAWSKSDPITAVATLNNRLFLFGPSSVEVYYGTGAGVAGVPPFRIEDTVLSSELGAARGIREIDGTLWWLDGSRRFVRLGGRDTQTISTPIEAQLQALSDWEDCIIHQMDYQGHHLLLAHFEKAGTTLVYDWALNLWSEWKVWNTTTGAWGPMPMKAYAYHPKWNKHFCAGEYTGAAYELSPTTYQDNSGPLVREWRGPFFDAGGAEPKLGRRYQFLVDGGTASTYPNTGAITAFADYSGTVSGTVSATSTAHGLSTNDTIEIDGTLNYDGPYTITKIDANSFYFTASWVSDDGQGGWGQVITEATEPVLEARIRNDDREWQEWQEVSLGQVGNYTMVRDLWCLTQFRTQQLEWRCSSPVALRVSRIQLEHRDRGR